MLQKTRGIVFKVTNYSETSVIAQVFTEKFGLQSYMLNGVKKPKAKVRMSMLQPLHLLDMVVYHKADGGIQRVAELRNSPAYLHIPYDIVKSSLVLFLNEILYKSIKLQPSDEHLFEYIFNSLEFLDSSHDGLGNFHLHFLLHLSRYMGFFPDKANIATSNYFDLSEGRFLSSAPLHPHVIDTPMLPAFKKLLTTGRGELSTIKLNHAQRMDLLRKLLDYYRFHIGMMGAIKSLPVLEEIMKD